VPGTGEQAAILQGGEYVLSRSTVQALAGGGVVKGYQNGGPVSTGSQGGGMIELRLSSEAKSSMDALSQSMSTTADSIRQAFAEVPGQLTQALSTFPAQLDSAAQVINEAAAQFHAGAVATQEVAVTLPESVATAFGEANTAMAESFQQFGSHVGAFSAASETWGQSVTQLANAVTEFATAAESMRGAASEIRDALAQEITISVTHTHEPITVTVEGGESTVQDGDSFSEMVMEVVGPEMDRLRDRIRETGYGIA
jgi:hypothetical protein